MSSQPAKGPEFRHCGRLLVLLAALVCCGSTAAWGQVRPESTAQNSPDGTSVPVPSPPAAAVRESQPSIFYLRNKDGDLVPVIDMKYEEYEALWRLQKGLTNAVQPTSGSLDRLAIKGAVAGDTASLDVEVRIQTTDDSWVRIPLRMYRLVLKEEVTYQGMGEHLLSFDEAGDGYVIWLRGGAGKTHILRIKALAPVTQLGGQTRLELSVPRSNSSELKLLVPVAKAVGTVSAGASLANPSHPKPDQTEFSVLGLRGEFQLAWREADKPPPKVPTVFEVNGNVLLRIDGQSNTTAEARLKMTVRGGETDTFTVRLPPASKLVPAVHFGYQVTEIAPPAETKPAANSPVWVEVKFDKPAAGTREVLLSVEFPPAVANAAQPVEMAGFEVRDAVRQWGNIALAVAGDNVGRWIEGRGVRRVDELPETLRHPDVVASFEYTAQPCSLKVRVLPKTKRIQVTPQYRLTIEPQQVLLEGRLKYTVRGGKVDFLFVDLNGWQLERIEPVALINTAGVEYEQVAPLAIPLVRGMTGEFEIGLFARRTLNAAEPAFDLALPTPKTGTGAAANLLVLPATVVAQPADNVQVLPRAEGLKNMEQEPLPADLDVTVMQQPPLFFRTTVGTVPATFSGTMRALAREVHVDQDGLIEIDPQGTRVQQRFAFRIAHEPLDRLTLNLPSLVTSLDQLEVLLDGQPVPAALLHLTPAPTVTGTAVRAADSLADAGGASDNSAEEELPVPSASKDVVAPANNTQATQNSPAPNREQNSGELVVILPAPGKIGACELTIQYQVPTATLAIEEDREMVVPLTRLAGGELHFTRRRLHLAPSKAVQVRLVDAPWKLALAGPQVAGVDSRQMELEADVAVDHVTLTAELARPHDRRGTFVEKAWLQTWLNHSQRRDRAVFQLTTSESELWLKLPDGVVAGEVVVLCDGRKVSIGDEDLGKALIQFPEDEKPQLHLVEVAYPFLDGRPATGGMSIQLPELVGATWVKQLYWQLITPADEHLIVAPRAMTAEATWRFSGLFWEPSASLSQQDLERWSGASEQVPPSQATNQYLFGSFGALPRVEFRTADRSLMLLVASGVLLVMGFLLIYVPAARHPALLLFLGVVLAGMSLRWPTTAALTSQAAALGLVLALTAQLLLAGVTRRQAGRNVVRGSASGIDRGSTELRPPRAEGSSQATTVAAPMAVGLSSPEAR